jgi:glutamyl-tRNA synthetase
MIAVGRYAPSPSGSLHLGNLRTALVGWLLVRQKGGEVRLRIEDLDPASSRAELIDEQLRDLADLGMTFDDEVLRQSEREFPYSMVLGQLEEKGLLYPCYCSRRDVAEATRAPHGESTFLYPGTCRDLTKAQRNAHEADGKRPALRLRADESEVTATDELNGTQTAQVDDFIVRRQDGVAAYNLAVVVDDAVQGVNIVVRGDDLWPTTPRQVFLMSLLGMRVPTYVHVPLVNGPDGERLAKRHGDVALSALRDRLDGPLAVRNLLLESLGMTFEPTDSLDEILKSFSLEALPRTPWTVEAGLLAG